MPSLPREIEQSATFKLRGMNYAGQQTGGTLRDSNRNLNVIHFKERWYEKDTIGLCHCHCVRL